jgi:hypothetical protein
MILPASSTVGQWDRHVPVTQEQVSKVKQVETAKAVDPVSEIQVKGIRFAKDEDTGQTLIQYTDAQGQERQLPAEVAIEQSKRIRSFLDRVGQDAVQQERRPGMLVDVSV